MPVARRIPLTLICCAKQLEVQCPDHSPQLPRLEGPGEWAWAGPLGTARPVVSNLPSQAQGRSPRLSPFLFDGLKILIFFLMLYPSVFCFCWDGGHWFNIFVNAMLKKDRKIIGCGGICPKPGKQENEAQTYLC